MPSPVGRPAETVSPEVSECSRMPDSRRPAASATSPCAPSWAMVTTWRVGRQRAGERTSSAATAAVPSSTSGRRSGVGAVTCAQNRPRSTPASRPAARRVDRQHAVQPAAGRGRDEPPGRPGRRSVDPARPGLGVGLQQQPEPRAGQVGRPRRSRVDVAGAEPARSPAARTERLGRRQVELTDHRDAAVPVRARQPGGRVAGRPRRRDRRSAGLVRAAAAAGDAEPHRRAAAAASARR